MTSRTIAAALAAVVSIVAVGCAAQNQQLATRVDALEKAQKSAPADPDHDAVLVAQIELLTRRLEAIEAREVDTVSKLEAKIDTLAAATRAPIVAPARRPEPRPEIAYSMPIDNDPFDGPADAKVTLVVGYDYACPYCEKLRDTLVNLRTKYSKDLRIVAKQMVVHPLVALAPALAACAAAKQKKFADMDKLLWEKGFKARTFDHDDSSGVHCWESPAGCPVVEGFATELSLDMKRFKTDLTACTKTVEKDMADIRALGVGAIPASFVNGRFLSGAMPIENFSLVIDEELVKATDRIKAGTSKATYYKKFVVDGGQKSL